MVCNCFDLRADSSVAKFLENKIPSVFVGICQLIFWVSALFAFMVHAPVKTQIRNSPAGVIAFAVILVLVCISFSVLLLIGLFKNKRSYLQAYLVFIIVLNVLTILSIIVNIITQPREIGLSGFLSCVLITLLDILTYFIVRNYYLAFISKNQNHNRV